MKRLHVWLTVVAGANLMLASLAGLLVPAQAQTDTGAGAIGGYTLNASAAATRQIFRPENNIIPAETLLDLSIPFSLASLAQGSGRAVGSTAWPGDTVATACRAEPSVPCYPFYAESFYPQGPVDGKSAQEIPGTTMAAHSEEQESVGKGEFTPQGGGGNSLGVMTSNSVTSIKSGTALAESVSRVSDLIFGGGAVRIESIVSHAKATSDGNAADAVGTTAVSGFTIAGFPVSVTSDGVSIAGQVNVPNPLGPAIDPVNAALEALGMQVSLSTPIVTKEGGKAEVIAGGLIISFDNALVIGNIPPEVKANFPIDPQGKTTLVFGQASAAADASPGFADDLAIEDVAPLVEDITETPLADVPVGDSVSVGVDASAPSTPAPTQAARVQAAGAVAPLDGKAVGLGLVLLALVGAVAAAAGMHRLATGLFQPIPVTACTQEKP